MPETADLAAHVTEIEGDVSGLDITQGRDDSLARWADGLDGSICHCARLLFSGEGV